MPSGGGKGISSQKTGRWDAVAVHPPGSCWTLDQLWIALEPLSSATSMNGKWKNVLKLARTWAKGIQRFLCIWFGAVMGEEVACGRQGALYFMCSS